MRTAIGRRVVGVALALALTGPAAASPWGRDPATLFTSTKIDAYVADGDGQELRQAALEHYSEVGLTDRWSLGGKFTHAWQTIETPTERDSRAGVVEAELYGQYEVFRRGNAVMSVQALYGFPTDVRSLIDNRTDDRDASVESAVLLGFGGERQFLTLRGGYRQSLGGDADAARLDLGWGWNGDNRRLYLLELFGSTAVSDADPGGIDTDQLTIAPSAVFPAGRHRRVQIGARADVIAEGFDPGVGGFIALWYVP